MNKFERETGENRAARLPRATDRCILAAEAMREHRLSDTAIFTAGFVAAQDTLLGFAHQEEVVYFNGIIPTNFGRHVDIRLIEDSLETHGIRRVQKTFASPDQGLLENLKDDLDTHVSDLERAGMEHLAKVYDPRVEPQITGDHALIFEQVLFPYGSTFDWLRQDRQTEAVTRSLIELQVLPLQRHIDERTGNPLIASASFDNNIKNFVVIENEDGEIKTYYCDFTPPRVIDPKTGRMKKYIVPETGKRVKFDLESQEESEAKRFLKDMQLANFVIRNVDYILDARIDDDTSLQQRQQAATKFLQTVQGHDEMRGLIEKYFGKGMTAHTLAALELNTLVDSHVVANTMG